MPAVEAGQIILVKNNPLDIAKAIQLSGKTNIKMKQNLAWAAGYNVAAIPVAAGVLYNWGILLRPEWGGAPDERVVGNSSSQRASSE